MGKPSARFIAEQTAAYTVASGAAANVFGSQTRALRLCATSACAYIIGQGTQTAAFDATSVFLPANTIDYVSVSPGQKIAAIRAPTVGTIITATDGTLFVTELDSIMGILASRIGTTQTIAYSTTTVATNAFGAQTRKLRLCATSACAYRIGDGAQTAVFDNTSVFLPALTIEYVTVGAGQRIAALQAPTTGLITATAGTLFVTELTD